MKERPDFTQRAYEVIIQALGLVCVSSSPEERKAELEKINNAMKSLTPAELAAFDDTCKAITGLVRTFANFPSEYRSDPMEHREPVEI